MACRKSWALSTVAAIAISLAGQVRAETLTDALIAAYRNSNLLEQNRAVLRAADEDVASAVAALRPTLAFIAASDYANPTTRDYLSNTLALSASLVLFDSGRRNISLDIARESVLGTRQALIQIEQNVLLEAVNAYMDVRSAEELVALNQNSVRVIGEEETAARDRFDVGEVTRTDVAQAEARLATAQADLSSAQGDLQVARERYKAATGNYPVNLAAPPALPGTPASLDEAKGVALRGHPNVLQAQREVNVAELNVTLAAAERRPTVDISARVGIDQDGESSNGVGLSLQQPLYQGGGLSALHRRAIAGRDSARAALQQSAVDQAYRVGNAWSVLEVSRATLASRDESIVAARSAYEGVREEARLGARTTLEVLDAEQDLLDAANARVVELYQQQVAAYALLSAMGLLTVEHLNLGIPTYDPTAYYNAVKHAPYTSVQGKRLEQVLRATGNR